MTEAYICDYIRTPIGRYAGALSGVRADDLAAAPLKALMARNPGVDWETVDDVYYGAANQAGEDNRNVASSTAMRACPSRCRARRSTGSAARAWMRSWPPPAPSRRARRA